VFPAGFGLPDLNGLVAGYFAGSGRVVSSGTSDSEDRSQARIVVRAEQQLKGRHRFLRPGHQQIALLKLAFDPATEMSQSSIARSAARRASS
jgi:hypothetical protein